jgi:hypothetical protein
MMSSTTAETAEHRVLRPPVTPLITPRVTRTRCVAGVHRAVRRDDAGLSARLQRLLMVNGRVTAHEVRELLAAGAEVDRPASLEALLFDRRFTLEARHLLLRLLKHAGR